MPPHFDPTLVNDAFGDAGLYVDLVFQKRAILFDLGDRANVSARKLLRVSDIFVTHRHMDHFAGFDSLLRLLIGREKMLSIFGPPGMIDAIEHKLRAYTWNLVEGYDGNLVIRAVDVDADGRMSAALFAGRSRFARADRACAQYEDGLLLQEPDFQMRAATLDHGVPVLAFALEERMEINILRDRVERMGLAVGPWLRRFKEAILREAPDNDLIDVIFQSETAGQVSKLPLGALRREIMKSGPGRKIAYVVDCAFTPENQEKIIDLARNADLFFIEATFLDADASVAAARRHLTARQAGWLARKSNAKRLVTLHYSPRYKGRGDLLADEAQHAFLGH
ncbi:ribonuclease Z [Rhodoblastus acidophilus]|uniref:Ribonuclease Z n=1 Tax=Candidatus Rhodoblastus alkanivorans TaxID=2954117 RepID=A0ABS9ZDB4_9HYPH|nr:MBL fold metallo-hydrolase [Candidatus Rhodoblastus alkanivorans]MCI4679365.1 ribonuclease Z [Candidatus Rhodoblastus alkanivorans]MCI4684841.1 ribonuclease Z [Candidatus Rhodoblastus alkanivorans]MDI4642165.1 ribonuclease Z [Rhodoblastus acidophilus]